MRVFYTPSTASGEYYCGYYYFLLFLFSPAIQHGLAMMTGTKASSVYRHRTRVIYSSVSWRLHMHRQFSVFSLNAPLTHSIINIYFNVYTAFSTSSIPSRAIPSLIGSQISLLHGARIPGLLSAAWSFSRSWDVMPQVMSTDSAMAEYLLGSPNSSRVLVVVSYLQIWSVMVLFNFLVKWRNTLLPCSYSTMNLCWSMTRPRSWGLKLRSCASWWQSMSKTFSSLIVTCSSESRPSCCMPEITRVLSASSRKE